MKLSLLVLAFIFNACSSGKEYEITHEQSGTPIITGVFNRSVIESDSAMRLWYRMRYNEYTVDTSAIKEFTSSAGDIRFIVIAGTWCSDSKREIPHFFKVLDAAHIPDEKVELHGVDRSKQSNDCVAEKYGLTLVPTFIVLEGEKELGRIVEMPKETIERDLIEILKNRNQ